MTVGANRIVPNVAILTRWNPALGPAEKELQKTYKKSLEAYRLRLTPDRL